jgi:hypothetical protein
MKITVETNVAAPIETVWEAYTTPEDRDPAAQLHPAANGEFLAP